MESKTVDCFCPACNMMVEAKVIAQGSGEYRSTHQNLLGEADVPYYQDYYVVALCCRCGQPFLVRQTFSGVPGEFEAMTDEVVLYPPSVEAELTGVPKDIARAVEEARRTHLASCFEACALMCRRALEALCDTLSADGNTLASRLADLKQKGHIDGRLLEWAHGVRLVGNEAAHDVKATVSADDARDILDFTEALLLYVFSLDARFRAFAERHKSCVSGSSTKTSRQSDRPKDPGESN